MTLRRSIFTLALLLGMTSALFASGYKDSVVAPKGWNEGVERIDVFVTQGNELINASEVEAPVGEFFSRVTDPRETVLSWRRTTAEQGLYYRDHMHEIAREHAGRYILLHMNKVVWSETEGNLNVSRRDLAGLYKDQALWMKYVDPDEAEGEHYEVYEDTLANFPAG